MNKRSKYYFSLLFGLLVVSLCSNSYAGIFTKNAKSLKHTSDILTEKQVSKKTSGKEKRTLFSSKKKRKSSKTMPTTLTNVKSFQEPMTGAEKEDVKYVLSSCANMSTFALAMAQNDIKSALSRIQEVHPLVLLEEILKNSLLTKDLLKIKSRGWIWNTFHAKLKEALTLVAEKNLLSRDIISTFAKNLNLEEDSIVSLLENRKWDDFLNTLVKE